MTRFMTFGLVALFAAASPALAGFDLQITEIWPGNEPGANLTNDWFELTNFGDTAWTAAADGDLYFDDDSFDFMVADLMMGIASIAPGESVIFVDGSPVDWMNVWGPDLAAAPQVGFYAGSGLSQGGDGVGLFLDTDFNGPQAGELFETEVYPDANLVGGQSYDVVLAAFSVSGNASGAFATTAVNDSFQPAVGSPGSIPEPTSIALLALGGLMVARRRA